MTSMVKIDGYAIDVVVTFERSREATVTQWPIESGATITDHVQINPAQVTMEGVITDAPMSAMSDERTDGIPPTSEAFERLNAIMTARLPVSIETPRGNYKDMILKSLGEPYNAQTGEAVRFRASFVEVMIVNTERSSVKITLPKGKPKKKVGSRSTKPVDGDDDADSVSNRLKDYAAGRRSVLGDIVDSAGAPTRNLF